MRWMVITRTNIIWMITIWAIVTSTSVFLCSDVNAIRINEIMHNPQGSDNNHEYIEILINDSVGETLENWTIDDGDSSDQLELVHLVESDFALIVEDGFDYSFLNCSIYMIGATIGNGLSVSDNVSLIDASGHTRDSILIPDIANNNGKSAERTETELVESIADGGTPCAPNSINTTNYNLLPKTSDSNISITIYLDQIVYVGLEYTKLFKVKNNGTRLNLTLQYSIAYDDGCPVNYSSRFEIYKSKTADTGYFTPQQEGNYTICGWLSENTSQCGVVEAIDPRQIPCEIAITLETEKIVYEEDEKVFYTNMISNETFPYEIEYWIEDIEGNTVRSKRNTSNTKEKSYKPSSKTPDVIVLQNKLHVICNNTAKSESQRMLAFRKEMEIEPMIFVEKTTPEVAEFGDFVKVYVIASRGNSSKYAVKMSVKYKSRKISEEYTFYVNSKFDTSEVMIPILLDDNCDGKLKDGLYELYVEGFGISETADIEIKMPKKTKCTVEKENKTKETEETKERTDTKKEKQDKPKQKAQKHIEQSMADDTQKDKYIEAKRRKIDNIQENTIIYQSKNRIIKDLISYFLISLIIVLVIDMFLEKRFSE